jgi:hypothetical protein
MTTIGAALLALAVAIAGCRSEHASGNTAPSPGDTGSATATAAGSPAGRLCLPAMVCVEWAGCALIAPDGAGKGTVVSADRLKPGEPVRLENGCNNGANCPAAKASPRDVVCPPIEIPPVLAPPGYSCVLDGDRCRRP